MRYQTHDFSTTAVSLAGREYRARGGVVEVPDSHAEAHRAAAALGMKPVPTTGK